MREELGRKIYGTFIRVAALITGLFPPLTAVIMEEMVVERKRSRRRTGVIWPEIRKILII